MQLSIVIVNYNVRYFLEQCLHAVENASGKLESEVIVVDNHSTDDSIAYLQPLFPGVRFICNEENLGFAKANNQALGFCRGAYVLFINPDTVIPEDCLVNCLAFMKAHPAAGALGVRMLDGKGRFLPESKRAFPSPQASFFKLSGLAALFPRSAVFNRYALGNLDERQDHIVDVLAGAYMMADKKILDELGGFDERYFLYGEDIDLSFRIQKSGRQNHYFAGTSIIHFKGESSRRGSLDHVRFFYRSMLLFVQKHYRSGTGRWFSWLLGLGIACRGVIAALNRLLRPILLPLADGALVWLSLQVFRMLWISGVREGKDFGVPFIAYALPLFSILFIAAGAITGLYDKPFRNAKTMIAAMFGVTAMLAMYALLPEYVRFSRGVVLLGGMAGGILVCLLHQWLFGGKYQGDEENAACRAIAVADEKEYQSLQKLLEQALAEGKLLGRVSPTGPRLGALGTLQELAVLEKQLGIREIIFCVGTLPLSATIKTMEQLSRRGTRFLFHFPGSRSIVGSDSPLTTGKTVATLIDYRIGDPYQQRMKRAVDIVVSFLLLLTAPVHLLLHRNGMGLMRTAYRVLTGNLTWVGYVSTSSMLPVIRKGVIPHRGTMPHFEETLLEKTDRLYAAHYDWWQDLALVFSHYRRLA